MFESPGKWERVRTDAGWHLRLKGANGEIVLTSETYVDKREVDNALQLVRRTVSLESFGNAPQEVDERGDH